MSLFHEKIKEILSEVHNFLTDTIVTVALKSEVNNNRLKLLNNIDKLRAEYPQLKFENSQKLKTATLSKYKSTDSLAEENYRKFQKAVPAAHLKNSEICGYLYKCRRSENLFAKFGPQRRWCVVKGATFFYYNKHTDEKQRCCFSLLDYKAEAVADKKPYKYYFLLTSNKHRIYKFNTNTPGDRDAWVRAINQITDHKIETGNINGSSLSISNPSLLTHKKQPDIEDEEMCEYNDPANIQDFAMPAYERRESGSIYEDPEIVNEVEISNEIYQNTSIEAQKDEQVFKRKESTESCIYEELEYVNVRINRVHSTIMEIKSNDEEEELIRENTETGIDDICDSRDSEFDYFNLYYARWDRFKNYDDELDLKSGDIICVYCKEQDDDDWWLVTKGSYTGLVPKNHLMPVYKQKAVIF